MHSSLTLSGPVGSQIQCDQSQKLPRLMLTQPGHMSRGFTFDANLRSALVKSLGVSVQCYTNVDIGDIYLAPSPRLLHSCPTLVVVYFLSVSTFKVLLLPRPRPHPCRSRHGGMSLIQLPCFEWRRPWSCTWEASEASEDEVSEMWAPGGPHTTAP